jgi:DNA-binding NtrC family response regulator
MQQPVRDLLNRYDWPGNIREMENLLERMVLMAQGDVLTLEDVPPEIQQAAERASSPSFGQAGPFKEVIRSQTEEVERQLILRALDDCGGKVTRAAKVLGLTRKGLQLKKIRYRLRT